MKALVYTAPRSLSVQTVDEPVPADGEVVVEVASVGICGSDMHAYLGHDERRPAPLVLGHEVAGTIASGPRAGQAVTVNPLVTCGRCAACRCGRDNLCPHRQIISMPPRPGGFAERIAIPERNLVDVPVHVRADQAALAEPIACGWHAVRLASEALRMACDDAAALVIGGGAIGLGAALSLSANGFANVTVSEPEPARRAYLAEHCGQSVTAPDELAPDRQFHLVVDAVGIEATRAFASGAASPGGVIVHIGLGSASGGLDIRRMTLQEITFIGTYTYTAGDFRDAAQAMFDGRLGTLDWTARRPLDAGADAFADLKAGRVAEPKIVLRPDPA